MVRLLFKITNELSQNMTLWWTNVPTHTAHGLSVFVRELYYEKSMTKIRSPFWLSLWSFWRIEWNIHSMVASGEVLYLRSYLVVIVVVVVPIWTHLNRCPLFAWFQFLPYQQAERRDLQHIEVVRATVHMFVQTLSEDCLLATTPAERGSIWAHDVIVERLGQMDDLTTFSDSVFRKKILSRVRADPRLRNLVVRYRSGFPKVFMSYFLPNHFFPIRSLIWNSFPRNE